MAIRSDGDEAAGHLKVLASERLREDARVGPRDRVGPAGPAEDRGEPADAPVDKALRGARESAADPPAEARGHAQAGAYFPTHLARVVAEQELDAGLLYSVRDGGEAEGLLGGGRRAIGLIVRGDVVR